MNPRYDIYTQLEGNKAAARDTLAIPQLISELFKAYEGGRATILSGALSAPLRKLWDDFQGKAILKQAEKVREGIPYVFQEALLK